MLGFNTHSKTTPPCPRAPAQTEKAHFLWKLISSRKAAEGALAPQWGSGPPPPAAAPPPLKRGGYHPTEAVGGGVSVRWEAPRTPWGAGRVRSRRKPCRPPSGGQRRRRPAPAPALPPAAAAPRCPVSFPLAGLFCRLRVGREQSGGRK